MLGNKSMAGAGLSWSGVWGAMRFAAAEAERLGLENGLHNPVGYATTGGPWIDEERCMQHLVWSDTLVNGGSTRNVANRTNIRNIMKKIISLIAMCSMAGHALSQTEKRYEANWDSLNKFSVCTFVLFPFSNSSFCGQVTTRTPLTAQPHQTYGESPSQTLQIMSMGGSVPQGAVPGGCRHPPRKMLTGSCYAVDSIGAKTQAGDTCPDADHWVESGWRIPDTPAAIEGRSHLSLVSIQEENHPALKEDNEEVADAITATYSDVAYGPDKKRNTLDFWRAQGSGPRPLLVNIHGGGWITGDKNTYFNYRPFLEKGISCASINYRLMPDNPLPAPVHDAARAIQFLRSKAAEWNMDPKRIALTGSSAGACSAMWLLLHDDLADPDATDPILRQSSRVSAVAAYAGQTSIDPAVISEWIPTTVPLHNMIPYAVGQTSMAAVWPHADYEDKYRGIYEEFSPINHLDANDPPLYLEYNRSMMLPARSDGDAIHHPVFGVRMWEKSNSMAGSHDCHLRFINSKNIIEYRKTTTTSYATAEEFLLAKLLVPDTSTGR